MRPALNRLKAWLELHARGSGYTNFARAISSVSAALEPKPRLSPDRWADQHRVLSKGSRPGPWSTDMTPYMREVCEAFHSDEVETITLMWSTQIGKTALLENIIGYLIDHAPCPIYMVLPDEKLVRDFKQEKLEDLFESSGFYKRGLVSRSSPGKSETTARKIRFKGGFLAFATANSLASLAGRSIRILVMDEVDQFPLSKTQGDILTIAINRTNSFADNRKILITSTPTQDGASNVQSAYMAGDQRKFEVACPHCNHRQFLVWDRLLWNKEQAPNGKHIHLTDTAYYQCEKGCHIAHGDKPKMLKTGKWIATGKALDTKHRSYHLTALYSPFVSYPQVAAAYVAAKEKAGGLRSFFNTYLAQPYADPSEQPAHEMVYARAEGYSRMHPPKGVAVLTCGVDVQEADDGRLEASVWGWGANGQRWLVDHIVIDGSYKEDSTWAALDKFRHGTYVTEDGRELSIAMTMVDSGAVTKYVYTYCLKNRLDNVLAIKGNNRDNAPKLSYSNLDKTRSGKVLKGGLKLLRPNVSEFKSELYSSLMGVSDSQAAYYIHTPAWVGKAWHEQLCAEKVTVEGKKKIWKAFGRNEALDCAVYAHVAAYHLGVHRWDMDDLLKHQGQEEDDLEALESVDLSDLADDEAPEAEVELEVLRRVQIGPAFYAPGDIVCIPESMAERYTTGDNPFAHRTDGVEHEKPIAKPLETAQKAAFQSIKTTESLPKGAVSERPRPGTGGLFSGGRGLFGGGAFRR